MATGDILAILKNRGGNILINGAFEFDQEKEGGSYSSTGYTLDQWRMEGATSCLRAAVTTNEYGYVLRATSTAANNRFSQRIEQKRVKHLVGKTLTFSIYAQVTSGSWSANPIKAKVDYANAVDNFAAVTNVYDANMVPVSGSNIPSGTRRRFYYSFVVTTQMAENGFQIQFGDFTNATNVVEYSMASLIDGGLVPFARTELDFYSELRLCQRYYRKTYNLGVAIGTATDDGAVGGNYGEQSATGLGQLMFKPTFEYMRGTPTITIYDEAGNVGKWTRYSGAGGTKTNNSAYDLLQNPSNSSFELLANSTNGHGASFHYIANSRL